MRDRIYPIHRPADTSPEAWDFYLRLLRKIGHERRKQMRAKTLDLVEQLRRASHVKTAVATELLVLQLCDKHNLHGVWRFRKKAIEFILLPHKRGVYFGYEGCGADL